MTALPDLDTDAFCYLTTIGRITGRQHTIEIWFAQGGDTLYMLSGGGDGSDWVRNLVARTEVTVRVGAASYHGSGRVVTDPTEAQRARALVFAKYQPGYGDDLTEWRDDSLPVAVDLVGS